MSKTISKNYRLEEYVINQLNEIASKSGKTETQIIRDAINIMTIAMNKEHKVDIEYALKILGYL